MIHLVIMTSVLHKVDAIFLGVSIQLLFYIFVVMRSPRIKKKKTEGHQQCRRRNYLLFLSFHGYKCVFLFSSLWYICNLSPYSSASFLAEKNKRVMDFRFLLLCRYLNTSGARSLAFNSPLCVDAKR